jgi:hypothetical protein
MKIKNVNLQKLAIEIFFAFATIVELFWKFTDFLHLARVAKLADALP